MSVVILVEIAEKTSLVILIDEYDALLTTNLGKEIFEAVRTELTEFFLILKSAEGCLRFFFMTGITKFQSTSIFSAFKEKTQDSCVCSRVRNA